MKMGVTCHSEEPFAPCHSERSEESRSKNGENLPVEVAEILRQASYKASTVSEQQLGGKADLPC